MPLPDFNAMEYIWGRLPKQKDGKTIRYLAGDIPYLYNNGFVDCIKFSLDQWQRAFVVFRQSDGTYVLNKEQFMALRVFRYTGPTNEVFDAMKIRPGTWFDDKLKILYEKTIRLTSTITEEVFWTSVKAMKKAGLVDAQGNLFIDDRVKTQINYLVDRFPSPRRRLEKEVARLRKERDSRLSSNQKNRDASGFIVGKAEKETKLEDLKKLQSSATSQNTSVQKVKTTGESLDLKSLRKSSAPSKIIS